MGKFVRVLVVLCLLLSIGALVLGWMLFNKRELLKGRAQKMEQTLIQMASLVEADPATQDITPRFPPRDISPNRVDFLGKPDYSTFWDSYNSELEIADQATIDLGARRADLMRYYNRDAEGKIRRDPMGLKMTTGPGTMHDLLQTLLKKQEEQYNRLNDTRQQLKDTREELVRTIEDLNSSKKGFREALNRIIQLEAEIARLEGVVRERDRTIQTLQAEKRGLEDALAEERRQVQLLEETIVKKNDDIRQLEDELKKLREAQEVGTRETVLFRATGTAPQIALDEGIKGSIVAVNPDWNFTMVGVTDAFLTELLGPDLSGALPPVELMVKRVVDGQETFVTKIRLKQIRRDRKMAIADILSDWQVMPIQEGDVVFF